MTVLCSKGHSSQAADFCDTCGVRIDLDAQPSSAGSQSTAGAPAEPDARGTPGPAAPQPAGQTCPHCLTDNLPEALFCEACGYDFTTGALPRGAAPAPPAPTRGQPATGPVGADGNVAPPITPGWVAEIWVDPDWYDVQDAEDPLPTPDLPSVIPLTSRSALIGRVSASLNITPDIDCTADTGVSRRHAQLSTDGRRWFVEDLGSSNGTFIGPSSGPLPEEPIAVGPRSQLDDDDRIYVGAWTRIVVRRALTDELAAPPN